MNSADFYSELSNSPPVPEGIFPRVTLRIKRRKRMVRALWALAACVAIAAGVWQQGGRSPQGADAELTEATSELDSVSRYLNAEDLNSESDAYVLVEAVSF